MNKFYLKEWHSVLKNKNPKGKRKNIKGYYFPLFSIDMDEMQIPLELNLGENYNDKDELYNCLGISTKVYFEANGCGNHNCCPAQEFHELLFVDILMGKRR